MKRRMTKKMGKYKVLPLRLINKYIYYTFRICSYWSLDTGMKVYIMANDERFGGVVTDEEWKDIECRKFTIIMRGEVGIVETATTFDFSFLAFHTREQRNLFIQENLELVKQFYML